MDELMQVIANLIQQFGGAVIMLGIVIFVVIFLFVVGIFCYVIKSMRDMDKELDDKFHFRNRRR